MALINRYAAVAATGALTRANMGAGAAYLVPANRILHVTEIFAYTTDVTGANVFLTTGVGGLVPANDRVAIHCPAANPYQKMRFGTPIEFAAGTTVTLDETETNGAGVATVLAGWTGYTK
ncbi:MAG: hypothetical protein ABIH23_32560 [bacterium]